MYKLMYKLIHKHLINKKCKRGFKGFLKLGKDRH